LKNKKKQSIVNCNQEKRNKKIIKLVNRKGNEREKIETEKKNGKIHLETNKEEIEKQENVHLRLLVFLHHFDDSSIAKTRSAVVPSNKKIQKKLKFNFR
jgi:hypothetical protein